MIATRLFAASLAALSLVLAAPALAQTTVTLRDGLNSYAGTRDNDALFGSGGSLADLNRGSQTNWSLNWNTSIGMVRFAIFAAEGGPVPDGATIVSATLALYQTSGPASTWEARRLLKDWQEMEATWNIAATGLPWQTPGAQGASDIAASADGQSPSAAIPGWLNIDVTSGVQAFAGGTPNYGWRIGWVSGTTGGKLFRASESGAASERPTLTIVYTQETGDECSGAATWCATFEPATTQFGVPSAIEMQTDLGLDWWVGNKSGASGALDSTRIALVNFGRDGNSAIKFTTQLDDRCVESGSCHPFTYERSEIRLHIDGSTSGGIDGQEWWYAHSVYFPPEYTTRKEDYGDGKYESSTFFQFHNGSSLQAFVLEVYNQPGNQQKVIRARATGPTGPTTEGTQYSYIPPGAGVQSGQCIHDNPAEALWYDFVHHIGWSNDGQGFHHIWMREGATGQVKKVLEKTGISMLYPAGHPKSDRTVAYLKFGNYHFPVDDTPQYPGERLKKENGQYLPPVTVGVSSVIHDRVRRGPTFASVAPPLFTMPSMENLPCAGISLP